MKHSNIIKFLLSVFLSLFIFSCSYNSTYTESDLLAGLEGLDLVVIEENSSEIIVSPVGSIATNSGFIFYPGAYVSYDAYLPLMVRLAAKGFKCVIVNMPSDVALLDKNAADRYIKQFPEITEWYLGGHSLGGATACMYMANNYNKFAGLVLLAAFSTKDLTNSGLKVLSVYGTEDGVLNMESYEEDKPNLPSDFTEVVIKGGNHAGFANYGAQKGDNEMTNGMTAAEQQRLTAQAIVNLRDK